MDVLFLDYNFAHEADIETSLWMKVHHKTIEAYRSRINKVRVRRGFGIELIYQVRSCNWQEQTG